MDQHYQTPIESVYNDLKSSSNGLSRAEAKKRLKINGPNLISKKKILVWFFNFCLIF